VESGLQLLSNADNCRATTEGHASELRRFPVEVRQQLLDAIYAGVIAGSWFAGAARRGEDLIAAG
jgi:hypothetical protein